MFVTSSRFRFLETAVALSLFDVVLCGCGAGVITHRNVDEPSGYTKTYGAPKNTTYSVQSQTSRHRLHLSIFEQSECDVYKTRLVSRTRETLSDGEVIGREASTLVQIVEEKEGVIACEKSYASGLDVHLRVGNATYRLGKTSANGELHINVADLLKRNLYKTNEAPTEDAIIVVQPRGAKEPQEVGTVSLAQLADYERRIEELLAEFRQLLEKGEGKMSDKEITRSYELYEQLDEINAGDKRVEALQTRFLELFYGRKEREATASLERNLDALAKAKNVLATIAKASDQYVPNYVSVAVNQSNPTDQALSWARGRLVMGIRQQPELCGPPSGAFSWNWFNQRKWPLATELALALLHYAFNDPYQQKIQALCKTAARW